MPPERFSAQDGSPSAPLIPPFAGSACDTHQRDVARTNLGITRLIAQHQGGGDIDSQPAELTVGSLNTDVLSQGGQGRAQLAPKGPVPGVDVAADPLPLLQAPGQLVADRVEGDLCDSCVRRITVRVDYAESAQ